MEAATPGLTVETLRPGTIACLEPGQIIKYYNGAAVEKIGCIQDIFNISKGSKVEMVVGDFRRRYRFFIHDPKTQALDKQVLENGQVSVLDIKLPLPGDSIDLTRVEYHGLFIPLSTYKSVPFKVLEQEESLLESALEPPAAEAEPPDKKEIAQPGISEDIEASHPAGAELGGDVSVQEVLNQEVPVQEPPVEMEGNLFTSSESIFINIYESFRNSAEEVRNGLAEFSELINQKTSEISEDSGQRALEDLFFLQKKLQDGITALLELQEANMRIQDQLMGGLYTAQGLAAELQNSIQKALQKTTEQLAQSGQEKELAGRIMKLPECGRTKICHELSWLESNLGMAEVSAAREED